MYYERKTEKWSIEPPGVFGVKITYKGPVSIEDCEFTKNVEDTIYHIIKDLVAAEDRIRELEALLVKLYEEEKLSFDNMSLIAKEFGLSRYGKD